MLKFSRNKLIGIEQCDEDTLAIHGILDDDVYSVELDLRIRISDLKLLSIDGKFNRCTTPDCPRADQVLQEAVGFQIEKGVSDKIHKIIGRKGCRHYANLLIECFDSAKQATSIIGWKNAQAENPHLTYEEFIKDSVPEPIRQHEVQVIPVETTPVRSEDSPPDKNNAPDNMTQAKRSGGCIVDLHVHTFPASPCSSASEDQMIAEAKRIGLDAVCLTDHNYVWDPERVEDLSQKHGLLVLRGNEIITEQGDMLVFGMDEDIKGIIKLADLKKKVAQADGFLIVAHPFRGFYVVGIGQVGLTVEKAMERPLFKWVDAVEVLNGKVTEKENSFALTVARGIGLPATGGSDAHEVSEVGKYATRFFDSINNERDLIEALRNRDYSPIAFRKEKGL
ncbi:PHP-associated domain-containing protein [Thermodesulfobacteriota bacterium]